MIDGRTKSSYIRIFTDQSTINWLDKSRKETFSE